MNPIAETGPAWLAVGPLSESFACGSPMEVMLDLHVTTVCLFDPVLRLFIRRPGEETHVLSADTHQGQLFFPWLPRGNYSFRFTWPVSLSEGDYEVGIAWGTVKTVRPADLLHRFRVEDEAAMLAPRPGAWSLEESSRRRIGALSWQEGMSNWFHRHFCHAAVVIAEKFLADSPLLGGRILDIGAGEGITDLGIFLRYRPQELVAMDIVDYMEQLPRIAREHDLPLDRLPERLTFLQQSCEHVPYPDESFDLVISWGSLEHIAGGYRKALDEVWRVLKPGGLFFVNPGLYYSAYGSHLGEFSDEPHLHLKISGEELQRLVLNTQPKVMDRAGFDVASADYWRFYKELNRIRVAEIEAELKAYGYRVVRAALRTSEMVEYTPALEQYSIQDLAVEDAFFTLQKPEAVR
jgi:ubiquinone/menaquinone biosynthesis C-methylase UbiE